MDEKILRTLRAQAWERAKGELQAMIVTFWGGRDEQFKNLDNEIKKFIEKVEGDGLHE